MSGSWKQSVQCLIRAPIEWLLRLGMTEPLVRPLSLSLAERYNNLTHRYQHCTTDHISDRHSREVNRKAD